MAWLGLVALRRVVDVEKAQLLSRATCGDVIALTNAACKGTMQLQQILIRQECERMPLYMCGGVCKVETYIARLAFRYLVPHEQMQTTATCITDFASGRNSPLALLWHGVASLTSNPQIPFGLLPGLQHVTYAYFIMSPLVVSPSTCALHSSADMGIANGAIWPHVRPSGNSLFASKSDGLSQGVVGLYPHIAFGLLPGLQHAPNRYLSMSALVVIPSTVLSQSAGDAGIMKPTSNAHVCSPPMELLPMKSDAFSHGDVASGLCMLIDVMWIGSAVVVDATSLLQA